MKKSDIVAVTSSISVAFFFSFVLIRWILHLRIHWHSKMSIEMVRHTFEAVMACRKPREDIALNRSQVASEEERGKTRMMRCTECNTIDLVEWKWLRRAGYAEVIDC